MTPPPDPGPGASQRTTEPGVVAIPIWSRPWFQFLLGATAVFVFLSFTLPPIFGLIYALRAVLTPVIFALVLAYIVNPVVTAMDRHLRLPRWLGTGILMAAAALTLLLAVIVAVPLLANQGSTLLLKLRDTYPKIIATYLEDPPAADTPDPPASDHPPLDSAAPADPDPDATAETDPDPTDSPLTRLLDTEQVQDLIQRTLGYAAAIDGATFANALMQTMDVGTSVVGTAISFTTYWLVFAMVAAFSFFFLSWQLGAFMDWFIPFIPVDHRDRTLSILSRMNRTVSAWLRGRLFQAFLLTVMLTVGWGIAGVPYWFLLGLLSGILGLVPYLIVVGWAIALTLTALDALSAGQFTWWILLWPTVVYVVAQAIDGWIVEPLVQGKATEMGTLTVLLVVMIGGTLGGLIGLLVAIPVAACIKILCTDLLLPYLRDLAAGRQSIV